MKKSDLIEQRAAIVARMNEAHTADNGEAFTAAETELRALDGKLDRQRKLDDADRRDPGTPLNGGTDEHLDRELRSFSITRMIAHKAGFGVDAGREIEVQPELAKRAGKPAEGFYVPTEIFEKRVQLTSNSAPLILTEARPDQFISALTNSTVMQALGATVLTGLTSAISIPRELGSPQVGWVAENQALGYSDANFDSVTLTPHHVGAITEMSRNMVMQASPSIEGLLREMLARNIGIEIDRAAVNGSGTGAEPKGILNDTAVPSVAFDTDLFITTANMMAKADIANVSTTRGFLSTNGVKATAAKSKDAAGFPLGITTVFHDETTQFSNQVPSTLAPAGNKHGLIYGDWRDFLIGVWSQLDILVNPYAQTAYEKGNLLIRAMATVDFGIRRPASFVKATSVVAP